jgi:carboxylesterase
VGIQAGNRPNTHVPAIVPARNATHILGGIHSRLREQVQLPNSYHVATLDNDAELIHQCVQRFFKQALAGQDL